MFDPAKVPKNYPGGQIGFICDAADEYGTIDAEMRRLAPGIHFCPDWDDLAICDASPEKKCCTCRFDLKN